MTETVEDKVGGYLLGMKQRLEVAAALLGKPQYLTLDKPINGLDPEGVSRIRHTIRALAAQGCAVFVSSRLLSEMQLTAGRIVIIGHSRMIGEYSIDEFLADGTVIEVEVDDPARLSQMLGPVAQGADVDKQLRIPLYDDISEQQPRRDTVTTVLCEGPLVTRLQTKRDNLEEKLLAATQESQEYRAQAIGQQGSD